MNQELLKLRHSLSHILAQSVQRQFWKNAKLWIWPAIEDGFYYDFDFKKSEKTSDNKIWESDLKIIQKDMEKIIKQKQEFSYIITDIKKAKKINEMSHQEYKNEIVDDFIDEWNEQITFYINTIPTQAKDAFLKWCNQGYISIYEKITQHFQKNHNLEEEKFITFIDMCQWPHIDNTDEIDTKSFKLSKIAGAYRKWDEKNPMMTRIYGYAFENWYKLKEHLNFLEEAKKRDHRVLWKKLDLFCFSDLVWPGLPLFTPRGTKIISILQNKIEQICSKYWYQKVMTPHIAKTQLFEISWHAKKHPEELFHVYSGNKQDYSLKPVQCPHQTQIYASKKRSYKELPIRYMESNKQYRSEQPWEISWLSRVVAITVEDGHVFCTVDQVKEEVKSIVNIIKDFFSDLWLRGNHWVSLSVRDPKEKDKCIWKDCDRKTCEDMLEQISKEMNLQATRCEWEAAVYWPKLDFMFKDSLGRQIQISTIQLDFASPKKFWLVYTDESWNDTPPVMIHRAILGSYERFLVILIEHFAWLLPFWLAPTQVVIVPVADKFVWYAEQVANKLIYEWIRAELDDSTNSFNKKIRNQETQKIPYILVVWEKEQNTNKVNVRDLYNKNQYILSLEQVVEQLKNKNPK